ncbi:MAG TPA: RNA-binding protein, partial [Iamia sp.]
LISEAQALAAAPVEPPTWSGWAAVTEIGRRYGIDDPNRIKPGVGESTRVLLRRKPDRLLVRDEGEDVAHLLQLAAERDVPVEQFSAMPYSSCGLISSD